MARFATPILIAFLLAVVCHQSTAAQEKPQASLQPTAGDGGAQHDVNTEERR
jgi:hypothetical protein